MEIPWKFNGNLWNFKEFRRDSVESQRGSMKFHEFPVRFRETFVKFRQRLSSERCQHIDFDQDFTHIAILQILRSRIT